MDEFCETGVGACDLRRPGVLHNVILQLKKQESAQGGRHKSFLAKRDLSVKLKLTLLFKLLFYLIRAAQTPQPSSSQSHNRNHYHSFLVCHTVLLFSLSYTYLTFLNVLKAYPACHNTGHYLPPIFLIKLRLFFIS